jgi:hypothetical protein
MAIFRMEKALKRAVPKNHPGLGLNITVIAWYTYAV